MSDKKTIAIQTTDMAFYSAFVERRKASEKTSQDYIQDLIRFDIATQGEWDRKLTPLEHDLAQVLRDPSFVDELTRGATSQGMDVGAYLMEMVTGHSAPQRQRTAPEATQSTEAAAPEGTVESHGQRAQDDEERLQGGQDAAQRAQGEAQDTGPEEGEEQRQNGQDAAPEDQGEAQGTGQEEGEEQRQEGQGAAQEGQGGAESTAPEDAQDAAQHAGDAAEAGGEGESHSESSAPTVAYNLSIDKNTPIRNLFLPVSTELKEEIESQKAQTGENTGTMLLRVIASFLENQDDDEIRESMEESYKLYEGVPCEDRVSTKLPIEVSDALATFLTQNPMDRSTMVSALIHNDIHGQEQTEGMGMSM